MRTFLKLGDRVVDFDKIVRVELDASDDGESVVYIHTNQSTIPFHDQDASILRDFFGQGDVSYTITGRPGVCGIADLTPIDEPAPQFAAPEGKLAASKLTEHDIAKLITGCLESAGLGKFEIFSFSPLNAVELDADQGTTRAAAGEPVQPVPAASRPNGLSLESLARGYLASFAATGMPAYAIKDIVNQIMAGLARVAVETEVANLSRERA